MRKKTELVCSLAERCALYQKVSNSGERCVHQEKHPTAREAYLGLCQAKGKQVTIELIPVKVN